ncbi:YARHG domain-containing protein [Zobellia uliginosa]|uniref:YARHG domain-containing protein n=1 Tax=Zobellia uliginosa TaxID=143224 RepID=A0ABY1KPZ3_9FLAO|nr:YARHG domain-containing protein [Zobellia uliginosa]SIS47436.1 YARHG domain-containing protein [Zobellia uliginosa]
MRIVILFLFTSNFAFAQYWGGQEINASDLSPWVAKSEIEYAGSYHFGESESESDLRVFFSDGCIIGQVLSGYWEESTGTLKANYITLTHIAIDKNGKFTSDQHSGQFIRYKTESGDYIKGLKINNPWSSWIEDSEFEIGARTELKFEDIYSGKYRQASFRKLHREELNQMGKDDLKLMRNEIFARYGYIFKEGGDMDKYFKKQKWYRPEHEEVEQFLTEIERYNVELIKKIE